MTLLILAVLLTVMQTPPPVQRKAADNKTGQTAKHQYKPNAGQNKAAAFASSPASPSTPQSKETATTEAQKNVEETIRVRELPPVTVTARPDWWNRVYVLLTAVLVTIGFFG